MLGFSRALIYIRTNPGADTARELVSATSGPEIDREEHASEEEGEE